MAPQAINSGRLATGNSVSVAGERGLIDPA
jgi:hypothetical protein